MCLIKAPLAFYFAIPPFVSGREPVSRVLTEDIEEITGGNVILEGEIVPAAEKLALMALINYFFSICSLRDLLQPPAVDHEVKRIF